MSIVSYDVQSLVDQWMEAEQNGVQFPVDFDIAWRIAGYSTKSNAKSKGLNKLEKGIDFSSKGMKSSQGGRSIELIGMTCDAFKHFCLMARTEEGRQIRQYFIETEKKWKLLEKNNPVMAQQIEYQQLINEGHRLEAQKHNAELAILQFRKMVVDIAPEPVQQKVLGYSEVKTIEYRDRLIKDDDVINDGSTVTKAELCRRYGLLTRNGKPDYKLLNIYLDDCGLTGNPDCWDTSVSIREDKQLKRDAIPVLDDYYHSIPRARYIVE